VAEVYLLPPPDGRLYADPLALSLGDSIERPRNLQ
jgi:hypothetical protein